MLTVHLVPVLKDNYSYLLVWGGHAAVIDPGDGVAVQRELENRSLSLTHILVTHHHSDHIGGIPALKKKYACKVLGPAAEARKIPGLDELLNDGDEISIGGDIARIIATPGHTQGHIAYWFPDSKALFSGDTLFSLGCGRLLEGTADQLFSSLERLKDLPDDTLLFCGHEYTQVNAAFSLSLHPDNAELKSKILDVKKRRANNLATLPALLGDEKRLNPFLGCKNAEEFASLRRLKDNF